MNRRRFLAALMLPSGERGMTDGDVREYLETMRASQRGRHPMIPADGKLLFALAERLGAQRVLEIGTGNGYYTIWMALALRGGGRVVTIEWDKARYDLALANFAITGLGAKIDARLADPVHETRVLRGPFDLLLTNTEFTGIDAESLVRKRGAIVSRRGAGRPLSVSVRP